MTSNQQLQFYFPNFLYVSGETISGMLQSQFQCYLESTETLSMTGTKVIIISIVAKEMNCIVDSFGLEILACNMLFIVMGTRRNK